MKGNYFNFGKLFIILTVGFFYEHITFTLA
jgi:hypothetical protein